MSCSEQPPKPAPVDRRPSGNQKRRRDDTDEFVVDSFSLQAMETTFITIHDLTRDANILYCSQSITDVLDYLPGEVIGRPCWEFFHPDEISFAKNVHGRGLDLDRASVLNYCRIRNKQGDWIGCECVFTVVYNVLIGCTSIYLDGPRSKKRAIEAPVVRQLFSSSPRDPRYHMLSYISAKFRAGPRPHIHEPRAALFLNRFTRTLTINFATNGLENLLGISAQDLQDQSFYYCIQENCLAEAVRCLESAKANDSIAYLRFWYRDPRGEDFRGHDDILNGTQASDLEDKDESMPDDDVESAILDGTDDDDGDDDDDDNDDDEDDEEEGGVRLHPEIRVDGDSTIPREEHPIVDRGRSSRGEPDGQSLTPEANADDSRHSSTQAADSGQEASNRVFDNNSSHRSSTPRTAMSLDESPVSSPSRGSDANARQRVPSSEHRQEANGPRSNRLSNGATPAIELEAVISCTSDGLVVIVRAARPFIPASVRVPPQRAISPYSNGLFASPWATIPIMPDINDVPSAASQPAMPMPPAIGTYLNPPVSNGSGTSRKSSVPSIDSILARGLASSPSPPSGPSMADFMDSIRDVAVFAWALTGINGSLQKYGTGKPLLGAVPHTGLPIWDPDGKVRKAELDGNASSHVQGLPDGAANEPNPKVAAGRNTKSYQGLPDGILRTEKTLDMREQEISEEEVTVR